MGQPATVAPLPPLAPHHLVEVLGVVHKDSQEAGGPQAALLQDVQNKRCGKMCVEGGRRVGASMIIEEKTAASRVGKAESYCGCNVPLRRPSPLPPPTPHPGRSRSAPPPPAPGQRASPPRQGGARRRAAATRTAGGQAAAAGGGRDEGAGLCGEAGADTGPGLSLSRKAPKQTNARIAEALDGQFTRQSFDGGKDERRESRPPLLPGVFLPAPTEASTASGRRTRACRS